MTTEGRVRKPGALAPSASSASARGPRPPGRRPLALAALALGAALAALLAFQAVTAPRFAPSAARPAPPAAPPAHAAERAPRPEPAAPRAAPSPVAAVEIEKAEVCEGEENLVDVRLRAGAEDPAQRVLVGGAPGLRVPLRRWLAADGSVEPVEVVAFGASGASYVTPVPPYRVRRCAPAPVALVEARALPNAVDAYELSARVEGPAGGPPAGAVRAVRWDYGDGERGRVASALTTHSYARREQRDDYTYVLVAADVELEGGRHVRARLALELANLAARSRRRGVTLLLSEGEPRVPRLGPDGVVEQRVRLWHAESGPVELERVAVVTVEDVGGRERTSRREVSPAAIFGAARVPPGEGLVATLRLDPRARPGLAYETYELRGRDAAGRPALGSVSVMAPTPPPSPTHGTPLALGPLARRVVRAQRLLGKPYVSRRELERLEREGAFSDLPADAAP